MAQSIVVRSPGFYWVKCSGSWTIGELNDGGESFDELCRWRVLCWGNEILHPESDFDEIGSRVIRPGGLGVEATKTVKP